ECQSKKGLACSNISPTLGTCIYGCHNDSLCATKKCDHISPHRLCTCNGPADCPNGNCFDGHCIYSCEKDLKCTLCNNQLARTAFMTACDPFLKGTVVAGESRLNIILACVSTTYPFIIETE
ncbi:12438_t:CDS:1, partial [Cetraspora pellucida]